MTIHWPSAAGMHALSIAVALLVPSAPGLSQGIGGEPVGAAEWVETDGGRVRLLLGTPEETGALPGALEIELREGWKTYWIAPGPAGIPPQLDAAGSDNVTLEAIRHPAPERFEEAYGMSTGYRDDVAFALDFALADPRAPATLRLDGFLGICEEICIPVPLRFEARIDGNVTQPFDTAQGIERARLALPLDSDREVRVDRVGNVLRVLGEGVVEAGEVYVAPPGTLALGEGRPIPGGLEYPILRGEGEGETIVVLRNGTGPLARDTFARPVLSAPADPS